MPSTDTTSPQPQADASTPNAAWHAVLCVEGVRTSDRREFTPGSLKWRALPLPLMMQLQTAERHQGSVVVGRIDRIERIDNEIHGWGTFDLGSENGREAHRLVSEQILRGVSIDAELLEIDREKLIGEDDEVALVVEEARIGAATIVSFQAFPQAVIALSDADIPESTPDGRPAAMNRKQDIAICMDECGDDDDCMKKCMEKKAKMAAEVSYGPWNFSSDDYTDNELLAASAGARSTEAFRGDSFLAHHEPSGALNRNGLIQAASQFTLVSAPPAALEHARSHLRNHFRDLNETPPKPLTQLALVAHADQPGPPAAWFVDPELKGPTPLTVARNGRIYGHAALWDACHTGYQSCMKPPRSRTNYSHFLVGAVFTSNCDCDTPTPTGPIVLSTTHADVYADTSSARRHYDNTGQAVADVAVGEDVFGIWVAGALRPGVSEAQIRALRGSSLSGDWRYIGGNMELISLLAVNTPGFPIPRVTAAVESGIQVALVAAGIDVETPTPEMFESGSNPADILAELKKEREEATSGESAPDDKPDTSDSADSSSTEDSDPAMDSASDDSSPNSTNDIGGGSEEPDSSESGDGNPPLLSNEEQTEAESPASSGLSASELLAQLKP